MKQQHFDGLMRALSEARSFAQGQAVEGLAAADSNLGVLPPIREGRSVLDAQAQWLNTNARVNVTIEGHADERGTREYNLALGERRANAAKNYLTSLGVAASRISVVSYGKERPIALGSNEQAWAQNRRAVSVVVN